MVIQNYALSKMSNKLSGYCKLTKLGINIDKVTQELEEEGVEKFNKAFDTLFDNLIKSFEKNKMLNNYLKIFLWQHDHNNFICFFIFYKMIVGMKFRDFLS